MADSFATLPSNMGKPQPGGKDPRKDPHKYIPEQRGGLLLKDPNEEQCPYTFKDSPAYVAKKKFEEQSTRAAELESKDETRGFLRSVEEFGRKQKWDDAFQLLERRTAVPSGLFLVTRAVLRWKFCKYHGALSDAEEALKNYSNSAKSGPLAAALSCFLRICLGSELRNVDSCSKDMRQLVLDWQQAEDSVLKRSALGEGLFHPRAEPRLQEPTQITDHYTAYDGTYVAASGVKIGYTLLKNVSDLVSAPIVVHFHGSNELSADYRTPELAKKYGDLGVHLFVIDFRGYGWSTDDTPSLATYLKDAEPFADKLGELFVHHGFAWPYSGGLILSGRSLGAQVAVHLATVYPALFRYLILDSSLAASATGDRLGRAPERSAALELWKKELDGASLDVLQPLSAELFVISALEKIRAFDGELLVLHGLADELIPYEGSESLHAAAGTRRKELVLIEDAGHNNIGYYDAYWSAQKRFISKIQLSDSVAPTLGKVQHLCAVCAEAAVSKCGRCQKVWYCGRKHQAEHWKLHKVTCAGGPPEPKAKVDVEADACLVVVVTANVLSEKDVLLLSCCMSSLCEQADALHSIYLSWFPATPNLDENVTQLLENYPRVVAKRISKTSERFEHLSSLTSVLAEAPSYSWVSFLELDSLWHPQCASLLLPSLRRAAVDQRIIAMCFKQHAVPSASSHQAPENAASVDASLEAGAAHRIEGDSVAVTGLTGYLVNIRSLQSFLESTPGGVLSHPFCDDRFIYKIGHTYGKKVHTLSLPTENGTWLCWSPSLQARAASSESLSDSDKERGSALFEGMKNANRFETTDDAAKAIAQLRRAVERRMVQWVGDKVTTKDVKQLANEQAASFLEEFSLGDVIGSQRWVRDVVSQMAETTGQQFAIVVSAE